MRDAPAEMTQIPKFQRDRRPPYKPYMAIPPTLDLHFSSLGRELTLTLPSPSFLCSLYSTFPYWSVIPFALVTFHFRFIQPLFSSTPFFLYSFFTDLGLSSFLLRDDVSSPKFARGLVYRNGGEAARVQGRLRSLMASAESCLVTLSSLRSREIRWPLGGSGSLPGPRDRDRKIPWLFRVRKSR